MVWVDGGISFVVSGVFGAKNELKCVIFVIYVKKLFIVDLSS